ncbi:MAG: biotin/lipoyl-containing protein [Pseudomonadota bacterium]|nr:biotin/lipoyl-containing protein [Pseudomonadota bacterium]
MANKLDIDPDLVRMLSDLLNETGLSEIEFESNGRRIRVGRQTSSMATIGTLSKQAAPESSATAPLPASDVQYSEQSIGRAITSPMVGTIFVSPEPGADPFVKLGDSITEGQTVMLIEAMKTYNPVRATTSGKVVKIFVEDSTPVEFGEDLLLIE